MKTKSIIYFRNALSDLIIPRLVEHDPALCPLDTYKREDPRWLTNREIHLKYRCVVDVRMDVHEKIQRRAHFVAGTAEFYGIYHRPEWGGPAWGRDYRFPLTPERIARSRRRHAKRQRRIQPRTWSYGSGTIDIAFGLLPPSDRQNFTPQELAHIHARLQVAATERGPLPLWRLSDCWPESREEQAA